MANQQHTENLPAYMMEEILTDSCSNSLSQLPEEHSILPNLLEPLTLTSADIGYFLFTRNNPDEPLIFNMGDFSSLDNVNFSSNAQFKIIIHGWTDTASSMWMNDLRRNYLKAGDFNVIIVDWSIGAFRDYLTSARVSKIVSESNRL